ncbi:MAG: transcription elongation factor GreA [Clostridia bacterium]|nr:transcription elongation factor GreA [Clostridia bacterium]
MGVKLSAEGKLEKERELEYLKTVRRKEVAEELKEARSHGDLSENAEYEAAKLAQEQLEINIAQLEELLRKAEVIDAASMSIDVVGLGSVVKFLDEQQGREYEYRITSSSEANPRDASKPSISELSPIGKCLLGHRVGDAVNVGALNGTRVIKILSIGR